jgi:hypothetical protein
VPARIEEPVKDVGPGFRVIQGLGQQVAVVVHHHSPRAQNAGERVVLGLGAAYPQHVIEQQIGNVSTTFYAEADEPVLRLAGGMACGVQLRDPPVQRGPQMRGLAGGQHDRHPALDSGE